MPDIFKSQNPSTAPAPTPPPQPSPPVAPAIPTQPTTHPTAAAILNMPPNQFHFSSFFHSLFEKPDGVSFAHQAPDENVLLLLHASFITNIPWIFFSIILLFVPLIIIIMFPFLNIDLSTLIPPNAAFILTLFYYLLVLGYAFVNYISWFYNVSIVSNLHVLDIEFSNISYKKIETITISDLADVSYTQMGFFQTFFDFGTIKIDPQTQNNSVYFELVPKPSYVTDFITDLKEQTTTHG